MEIIYTITCGVLIRIIDKFLSLGCKPQGIIIVSLVGIAGLMLKKSSEMSGLAPMLSGTSAGSKQALP